MAANSIVTPQTPKSAVATTVTANTTYTDSPTNVVGIGVMGSVGGRITRLVSIPRATVTATMMQLYASTDGGTTKLLIDSVLVPAQTVSATAAIAKTDWGYSEDNALTLAVGTILYVAQSVTLASGIDTLITWGDY